MSLLMAGYGADELRRSLERKPLRDSMILTAWHSPGPCPAPMQMPVGTGMLWVFWCLALEQNVRGMQMPSLNEVSVSCRAHPLPGAPQTCSAPFHLPTRQPNTPDRPKHQTVWNNTNAERTAGETAALYLIHLSFHWRCGCTECLQRLRPGKNRSCLSVCSAWAEGQEDL